MKTNIIVTVQVDALHNWKEAKNIFPEVSFLSDLHRHIFHIECKKEVFHDDRDIEFIMFKRTILKYLTDKYFNEKLICLLFEGKSCEMLCKELINEFDLCYCKVMEDNENGSEVII